MARKRTQNRKNPRGPCPAPRTELRFEPLWFSLLLKFGEWRIRGHRPAAHTHVPRGRPPRRHRLGRAAAPAVPSHRGASRPQGPATAEHGGHTEQDGGGPLLPRGHHTPATRGWGGGGANPGACVLPGGLCPARGPGACWTVCEVQPCPGAQGCLLRPPLPGRGCPGWGPSPPFGPRHQHGEKVPGEGRGGPLELEPPGLSLPGRQRDPGRPLPGLAPPGRTAHTAHKARSTLRRPRPHFTGRETEAAGTSSYSPHPPGVAPAGSACAPSSAPRSSGRSA